MHEHLLTSDPSREDRVKVHWWYLKTAKEKLQFKALCKRGLSPAMAVGSVSKPGQYPHAAMPLSVQDNFPSTPGKAKMERNNYFGFTKITSRWHSSISAKFSFWLVVLVFLLAFAVFRLKFSGIHTIGHVSLLTDPWVKHVKHSCHVKRDDGLVVLVTGSAGFVGSHVSLYLKKRGDGVLGIDNFNNYYDPSLKAARRALLEKQGIFVVEADINDAALLQTLFSLVSFTHVMHLAAQAGVRYAMENPGSYVHSNIAGLVGLFEACKNANPQPAVVWASSSSVYGLNRKVPFSEFDRTDKPASLYAATKKAGEMIAHTYNHIYGLSITGLRFFTVYGPWGRPDMAYFFFTKAILEGKTINVYQGPNGVELARDFTYIDDVVKGCVASLDTAQRSTGSGGKKKGPAQLRMFNLGNTKPVTVPDMVKILEKHLKRKAHINIVSMPRNGDVPFTHANITLAQRQLSYNPTTDLETGLKKFVHWYRSYHSNSDKSRSRP
ncbi:hypothetical protein O6H91_10G049900 [Diphasiastrum complanatum]|uniref:Uncharacterized protein n=10 Tax=Diphasiastrum complanatum TaxID=34168 RepID=A0ACC2CGL2_DIPCM|nr:hypothetical protein O6H91_10G049900 [Diphasiastrum complanatum]KAJ7541196.1 hypothetical protein O6H91_10G049900 [Diphasiastrum complanatum]KAJ7541197.1 hypothetical protein O6H91_10G049900 [Diphasiastrum complanatum]KAJ7541198.1 hypothetical protein O6H91_10G049900 [Diphasiastrum complanatum]KAJ7541199.1 hypothetical protein O6H91_10G049900 [Diphasiastrum complanatum]